MFSEVAETTVELLKTQVILMLNFTRPYAITYTKLNKKKKMNFSISTLNTVQYKNNNFI